jgi:hypothetical protein
MNVRKRVKPEFECFTRKPQMIEILVIKLKAVPESDLLFRFLIAQITSTSQVFVTMACWYAAVIDTVCQTFLIQFFEERGFSLLRDSPITMFWPLAMAFQSPPFHALLALYLKASGVQWTWIFPATEVVCQAIGANLNSVLANVHQCLLDYLRESKGNLSLFFRIAAFVVTSRPTKVTGDQLRTLIRESPFASFLKLSTDALRTFRDISVLDALSFEQTTQFGFGLRVDRGFVWKDAKFVESLMAVTDEKQFPHTRQLFTECLAPREVQHERTPSGTLGIGTSPHAQEEITAFKELYRRICCEYLGPLQKELARLRDILMEKPMKHEKHKDDFDILVERRQHSWNRITSSLAYIWNLVTKWQRSNRPCFYFVSMKMEPVLADFVKTIDRKSSTSFRNVKLIRLDGTVDGQLVASKSDLLVLFGDSEVRMPLTSINLVLKRQPAAVQIFTRNGLAVLLEFSPTDLSLFIKSLKADRHIIVDPEFPPVTELWRQGLISNFEYLVKLNLFAGRSFNDPNSLPVFPSVIADVSSAKLDLSSPQTFRDLSTPVACPHEFFCLAELVPNEKLLPWATSAVSFVYTARLALESDTVLRNLHHWIHSVFNIAHPERLAVHRDFEFNSVQAVPSCLAVVKKRKFLMIFHADGTGYDYELCACQFTKQPKPCDAKLVSLLHDHVSWVAVDRPCNVFTMVPASFSGYCSICRETEAIVRIPAPSPVAGVVASGHYLVALAEQDEAVLVYEGDRLMLSMHQHAATCCTVSEPFHTLAIGSEGRVVLYALPAAVAAHEMRIGGLPRRAVVTDSFGSVVVATIESDLKHFIEVFTINGAFVRKREIEGEMVRWTTWVSRRGLDYLAFVVKDGAPEYFFTCDVFSLGMSAWKGGTKSEIVNIKYLSEQDLLLVAQRGGNMNFIRGVDEN